MSNSRIDEVDRVAGWCKALSNPHRLRIFLRVLSGCRQGEPCCPVDEVRSCVGDLGRDLGIAPSTVSHHVKELRQAGLVRIERRGRSIECWADPECLGALAGFFSRMEPVGGGEVGR